jgi:hypothetical protein
MSHHLLESGPAAIDVPAPPSDRLRRLYLGRFVFAAAWAASFAVGASRLDAFSVTLLVLYPVVDVAATGVDFRSSPVPTIRRSLVLNMALGVIVAISLAIAAASGVADVLRVWGAWALTAGLVQLVVAVRRRRLGGQRPQILSGAISMLAGVGFIATAGGTTPSLTRLAGYAALGGIFFLASALRLRRTSDDSLR